MELFFVFIIGLILGSFLNVVVHRLPQKGSLLFPPSHCPLCQKPLKWYHNIPLLSYLFLRGKCAFCGGRISPLYPLVELLSALILSLFYLKIDPHKNLLTFLFMSYFGLNLLVLSIIDLKTKEIPDILSLPLVFAGWLLSLLNKNPLGFGFIESVISAFAGMGLLFFINELYYLLTHRESIGMGDFKLMGGIGAFLGYYSFFNVLFVASLLGIVSFILLRLIIKFKGREVKEGNKSIRKVLKEEIPFGPLLSTSAIIYFLYPISLV